MALFSLSLKQVFKMMCEVMPTIAEDPGAAGVQGDSNFEQVMVNLLDEREKLLETLRETQEQLETNKQKVGELEKENTSLQRQVNENTPQVYINLLSKNIIMFKYITMANVI